jgi:hypothetical protein
MRLAAQSAPENGEFANQTFYITESNWIRHVRITPLSRVDCLILCTDGAQELFYEASRPYGRAIIPLLKALADNRLDGNRYLETVLANSKAAGISGDDKTIAVLATGEFLRQSVDVATLEIHTIDDMSLGNGSRHVPGRSVMPSTSALPMTMEYQSKVDITRRSRACKLVSVMMRHSALAKVAGVLALCVCVGLLAIWKFSSTSPVTQNNGAFPWAW